MAAEFALQPFEAPQRAAKKQRQQGFSHESAANLSEDWYTPGWVFDALGLTFDLDPCSPAGGVPWIPAARHIALPENGLLSRWQGRVWLNPPYGDKTSAWLARMHEHRSGVALVFARCDTAWFHDYAMQADGILFFQGRVSFVDARGVSGGGGPGAGSIMPAWGADCCAAVRAMAEAGHGSFVDLTVGRQGAPVARRLSPGPSLSREGRT